MSSSVLIIDADEDFAAQLEDVLRASGFECSVTHDGRAGLDLARINIPAAIVLCVELPRMSGYSICAKLKKDDTLKSVPVIITSSEATPETFEQHKKLKSRADEYLKKPFPPALLMEVLRPYVGAAAPAAETAESQEFSVDEPYSPQPTDTHGAYGEPAPEPEPEPDDESTMTDEPDSPFLPQRGGAVAYALHAPVAAYEERDGDSEAKTNVGALADPGLQEEIQRLRGELEDTKERLYSVEAERNELAQQHEQTRRELEEANAASAAASSQRPSSLPVAQTSRELLKLKKEKTAKEREVLELREKLNAAESERLAASERETELEDRIVGLEEQVQQLGEANEKLLGEGEARASRIGELERSQEELRRGLGESTARAAEVEAVLNEKIAEVEQLGRENHALNERAESSEALAEKRLRELGELRTKIREVEQRLKDAEQRLKDAEQQIATLARRGAELEQELEETRGEVARLEGEKAEVEGSLEATRAELEETKSTLAARESALEEAGQREAGLGEQLAATGRELEESRGAHAATQGELDRLETNLQRFRSEVEVLRGEVRTLTDERERTEEHLRSSLEKREKAVGALEIALALLRESGLDEQAAGDSDEEGFEDEAVARG